jgi:peptidoglycan/xylan/chitin deacetylase (PgdA/CDA1 family)
MAKRAKAGLSLHGLAAITFDDGYRSVLDHAVPVLEEAKVPATLFLIGALLRSGTWWRGDVGWLVREKRIADFLAFASKRGFDVDGIRDDPNGFRRDTKAPGRVNTRLLAEVLGEYCTTINGYEEARASGVFCRPEDLKTLSTRGGFLRFGNHGFGHHVLSSLTPDQQREEVALGEHALRDLGLSMSSVFSVPFGGRACVDHTTRTVLQEAGYSGYLLSSGQGRTGDIEGGLVVLSRVMPADGKKPLLWSLARRLVRRC